jgi:hypothetical protein
VGEVSLSYIKGLDLTSPVLAQLKEQSLLEEVAFHLPEGNSASIERGWLQFS